jgi:hypothetical protein
VRLTPFATTRLGAAGTLVALTVAQPARHRTVTLNDGMDTEAGGGIASATFDPASVSSFTLNNSAVTGNSQHRPAS